jgi:hypothetical protein
MAEDEASRQVAPLAGNLHGVFAWQPYSFEKVLRQ